MDRNITDVCSEEEAHHEDDRQKQTTVKFRRLQSAPISRKQTLLYMDKCCNISQYQEYNRHLEKNCDCRRPNTATNMSSKRIQFSRDKTTLSYKTVSGNITPFSEQGIKLSKGMTSLYKGKNGVQCFDKDGTNFSILTPRNMYSPFLVTQGRCNTWVSDDLRREMYSETIKDRLKHERNRRRQRSGSSKRRGQTFITSDDQKIREPNLLAIKRFKVAILCVRILIKWLRVIIYISDKKTARTATEEQWHTLYTSEEAQKLAFNKSMFARERAFAKVPFWACQIFNTEPEDRTENDCRRIHALLRGLKSFDKFTEKIQLSMCKAFRYICVSPGRVILRKGHVGFNFYFVFSGSVFVNIEDKNIEGQVFEKTEAVLVRGDSFGELALLQDIRRTASITCRETCEMLVVDKETFAKVCPKIFEKELDEKEKFLSRLPLFNPKVWTKEMVKSVCTEAQIQEYKTNKVITTDDDEDWIYICMEGKCQIIRRMVLDMGRRNNKRIEDKRPSTPMLSDEILDILGKIKNVQERNKDDDSDSESDNDDLGKERMLDSMSLDYRKDGRRRRLMKHPEDKDIVAQQKEKMVLKGPTTLTSLMTQNTKSPDGKDYVYLNIGNLLLEELFDLFCVMYPAKRSPNSTLILVSCGSRMMRIKRKNFFKLSTREAVHHAKQIGKRQRYPTDEMLLESYKEKALWDNYKARLVKDIVRPHLVKNGRFSKITKAQINMMRERNRQKDILLSTLKRNIHISKATKVDELEDDDDDDESVDENKKKDEEETRALIVLKRQMKTRNDEPLPTDFSIGRRTSFFHGDSFPENNSERENEINSGKRQYSTQTPIINLTLVGENDVKKTNKLTIVSEES